MSRFCLDRDLLAIEPWVYCGGEAVSQRLVGGSGSISGTSFTAAMGVDLVAAGVTGGMVLSTYTASAEEARPWEIVSVEAAGLATVSVLRADSAGLAAAPTAQGQVLFAVRTFEPQIALVSRSLGERLRQMSEAAGVAAASFADSVQLRTVAAYGALASIFVSRAANATSRDANWVKAEHYRREFSRLSLQLRLAVDVDGDGVAEQTRTLGNVLLRRA